jgi:hypothetical protein
MRPKSVYLEWIDSCAHRGWNDPIDLLSRIVTVGWLVREDHESVTVSTSYDQTSDNFADQMVIPKVAITKFRKNVIR